jgi:hypothetical protein
MSEPVLKTEDDWQREATASAVASVRRVVASGALNGRVQVANLSDIEWGWIACAAIFGWIETKARQAVDEGQGVEATIRAMHDRDPEPWEAGAVATILPGLANIKGLDWNLPVASWSKEQIVSFAWAVHRLTDAAIAARNEGAQDKIVRFTRDIAEREHSAANKGPLMTHEELREDVPF